MHDLIFYGIYDLRSDDFGRTWTAPTPQLGLMWCRNPDGTEDCPCDGTPMWHAKSGTLLLTGHLARYRDDELVEDVRPRSSYFSVYDDKSRLWSEWQALKMPEPDPATLFPCIRPSGLC